MEGKIWCRLRKCTPSAVPRTCAGAFRIPLPHALEWLTRWEETCEGCSQIPSRCRLQYSLELVMLGEAIVA